MKHWKYLVIGLGLMLMSFSALAQDNERSPRFLVHLLDYLAKDYGGAVQSGRVISSSEYQEQVEFSESAMETNRGLVETVNRQDISEDLKQLHELIATKASAEDVAVLARSIQTRVIAIAHFEIAPTVWPSLKSGKEIFVQNCVLCHGATGAGDGPGGQSLDPKPANFLDEHMEELSPFQAFNTIRLGVPGTGMAPFHGLSDKEVWDVAFYLKSLRHQDSAAQPVQNIRNPALLKLTATSSDKKIEEAIKRGKIKKGITLAALRNFSGDAIEESSLGTARRLLEEAAGAYRNKEYDSAKTAALRAYLEGIEPIEPRLKASDPKAVSDLEIKMAAVRGAIGSRASVSELKEKIEIAQEAIRQAEKLLASDTMSPGLAFTAAATILLREGFEAVLIIIALLSVIRASGAKRAALWVHGGWVLALGLGALCWVFAGFLVNVSGAQREAIEGITSLFAVLVLLVVGFWLHSQIEIGRWKAFIHGRVQKALEGKNLWALTSIAFVAVFREAIETVLFLKAIAGEGTKEANAAVGAGVLMSLGLVIGMAWLILKYSVKLPIRRLFEASAVIMAGLAVILVGKGIHSFQETGAISVTNPPFSLHFDLLGIYPTWETLLSQLAVLGLVCVLWSLGSKPSRKN